MHAMHPAARERADERADRHRGEQEPDHLRARRGTASRPGREQRPGHPEDHGDEVDDEGRLQHPAALEEPEPVDQALPAAELARSSPSGLSEGRVRAHERDRGDRGREAQRRRCRRPSRGRAWPTMTPPSAGPTIGRSWYITWLRARADGSRSAGTRLGVIAARVASEKPLSPGDRPPRRRRRPRPGWVHRAPRQEQRPTRPAWPIWRDQQQPPAVVAVDERARRTATPTISGTSCTSPISADRGRGVGQAVRPGRRPRRA